MFALTQSSVPGAPERIKRVAVEDRDADVRAHALFWLAQTNAEGAGEWIVGRLDAEQDDHVREQAVFALSQLKDGTDWLLEGPALEARPGDGPARAVLARAVGRSAGARGDREDPGEVRR